MQLRFPPRCVCAEPQTSVSESLFGHLFGGGGQGSERSRRAQGSKGFILFPEVSWSGVPGRGVGREEGSSHSGPAGDNTSHLLVKRRWGGRNKGTAAYSAGRLLVTGTLIDPFVLFSPHNNCEDGQLTPRLYIAGNAEVQRKPVPSPS